MKENAFFYHQLTLNFNSEEIINLNKHAFQKTAYLPLDLIQIL
jgi:hypothetical protein